MATTYDDFIAAKSQHAGGHGFAPDEARYPAAMFGFQRALVTWAVERGRAAIMADCGLGKTLMALAWADQVVRRTNRPVLVATPLAVGHQFVAEGARWGIEAIRSRDGVIPDRAVVVVTNYEQVHKIDASRLSGMVCDESAILKSFDGARRKAITELMRTLPYRLLSTATPAPNDYVELGTSAEALGEMGYMDMLARYFVNDQNNSSGKRHHRTMGGAGREKFRFRGHAEEPFWRWVCSWARAVRRPSDLGFDDGAFVLPPLREVEHVVAARTTRPGWLFEVPASGLGEEREERRRTIEERCERVASLVAHDRQALVWCHLNAEADRLERLIPGAVQVSGSDSDEAKEERLLGFADGKVRVLVSKPKLGAWGLNFQRCAHVVTFPSHSYEQHYQSVRRCWRFGQTREVVVDVVATEGERDVMANLRRKAAQADAMFARLVANMTLSLAVPRATYQAKATEVPAWLERR